MTHIGKTINRKYHILRVIGQGGMGTVYEAEHTELNKKFALKMLHHGGGLDRDGLIRFKREARAAAMVPHEHIVQVTDIDEDSDGTSYIVMELLSGESLSDRLARMGRLPLQEAVDIVLQVLLALHATHDKGIVHRDLKPENISLIHFAGRDNWVKVLDFGLAKFKEVPDGVSITRKDSILGTPAYMAPEQLQREGVIDGRTDLYSCGIILYKCLAGTLPFKALNINGLVFSILHSQPIPPTSLEPSLPIAIEQTIMKAIAKNSDDRFATASDMAAALLPHGSGSIHWSLPATAPGSEREFVSAKQAHSSIITGDTSIHLRAHPTRRILAIALSVTVLLAAAGVGLYFLWSGSKTSGSQPLKALSVEKKQKIVEPVLALEGTKEEQKKNLSQGASIAVMVSAYPPDAMIYLDTSLLAGNPCHVTVPPDQSLHHLQVIMKGYTTYSEWVRLQGPLERQVKLEKEGIPPKKKSSIKYIHTNPYKPK